jgi:hypothetical protein
LHSDPSPVHARDSLMKPLLRTIGTAVLAAALLNASAGLCFCHRGPAAAGAEAASESSACCHGPQAPAGTTVGTPASCCHIESAESSAAPVAAVQVAPPAAVFTPVAHAVCAADLLPTVAASLASSSPPIFALRI